MDERYLSLAAPPVTLDALTARQREVVGLIAEGLTNPEIGARLAITAGAAANHVEAVLRRLGTSTRVGAAMWAIAHGLVRLRIPPASDGSVHDTSQAAF